MNPPMESPYPTNMGFDEGLYQRVNINLDAIKGLGKDHPKMQNAIAYVKDNYGKLSSDAQLILREKHGGLIDTITQ